MSAKSAVRNTTWAELKVGDTASIERTCSVQDLILFAHVSGNLNPLMLPPNEAGRDEGRPARAVDVGRLARLGCARQHPARPGHALSGAGPALPGPRPCRRQGHSHRRSVARSARSRSPCSTLRSSTPSGRSSAMGAAEIEAPTVIPGHRGARPAGVDRRLRRSFRRRSSRKPPSCRR